MDLLFIPVVQKIKIEEEPKRITDKEILDTEPPKEEENKNIVKKNSSKYVRKFIEKNKEKINTKIQCPICYSSYTYFNKSKHYKTKRHLILEEVKNRINNN